MFCFVGFNASAQNIANQVIASAGGSAQFPNGSFLDFTIGEPVISTTSTVGNVQLTQGFHQKENIQPLPVELTKFTASAELNYHLIKWTTLSEINNDYFVIERSTDGINFIPLKNVYSKAPNGNSSTTLNYSYTNYEIAEGNNYYRLKQFDKDGKWKYSDIVELNGDGVAQHIVALYPNPVQQYATLTITGNIGQDAKAKIISISGQTLKEIKINSSQTSVSLENINTGTYILQYEDGANKKNIKFIKL